MTNRIWHLEQPSCLSGTKGQSEEALAITNLQPWSDCLANPLLPTRSRLLLWAGCSLIVCLHSHVSAVAFQGELLQASTSAVVEQIQGFDFYRGPSWAN